MTDTLLEFPCRFPVKAIGKAAPDFRSYVVTLVREFAPDLADDDVSDQPSRAGNYLSVTLEIEARSKDQLDSIYRALSADERVTMAL